MRVRSWLVGAGAVALLPGCAALWPPFEVDLQAPGAPKPVAGAAPSVSVTRTGFEAKYVDLAGYGGVLFGARAARAFRFDPRWYGGVMAFGPMPLVGKDLAPAFGYTGVQVGWEGRLWGRLHADLALLAGLPIALRDDATNPFAKQVVVEPTAALGFVFPNGARLSLVGSTLLMAPAFADMGFSFGLRFETKSIEVKVNSED